MDKGPAHSGGILAAGWWCHPWMPRRQIYERLCVWVCVGVCGCVGVCVCMYVERRLWVFIGDFLFLMVIIVFI